MGKKRYDLYRYFYMSRIATGQTDYASEYYKEMDKQKDEIFNLQLRYWTEALTLFQKMSEKNFLLEEAVLLINYLCSSLEALAGVNINPPKGDTPALMKMYKETLKNDKGWELQGENPTLFQDLEDMNNLYTSICKHINRSDSRIKTLKEITYRKAKEYMRVTQEIWLWLLDKNCSGNIPLDQLKFFGNSF